MAMTPGNAGLGRARTLLSVVILAGLTGCMGAGGEAPATASTGTGGGSKLANMFAFNSAEAPPEKGPVKEPFYCPKVTVQPGTAAFTLYERGKEGDPLAVRYQANFGEIARECVDLGAEAGLRIGIAGRLLIGPRGTPGQTVDVPVRFVAMDDKDKVVISRVTVLRVAVPAGQTGIGFTHVEELGAVPMPERRLRDWDFRVGFDSKPAPAPRS